MAMAGNDRALAMELVRLFLTHYGDMHRDLRQAVAEKNPEEVRKMVHTIEGSLGALGSQDAIDSLLRLGQAGRDRRIDLFEEIFGEYDRAINLSNDVLEDILSPGI